MVDAITESGRQVKRIYILKKKQLGGIERDSAGEKQIV